MTLRLAWLAAAAALCTSCVRAAYPAPSERTLPALIARDPELDVDGGRERIVAMERECRARLSGTTVEASLAAIDRMREVLGESCDLVTVEHDPLHWLLRCRSDALFARGQYALRGVPAPCAERSGERVGPFVCMGSVLERLRRTKDGVPRADLELAVVGHVDAEPLRGDSDAHLCTTLQQRLGYAPEPAWSAVAAAAPDERRSQANDQLAFCRAASVAVQVVEGLSADGAAGAAATIAVLGVGASWLGSRPDGACPSTGKPASREPRCADARRVDLLLRLRPRIEETTSRCDVREGSTRAALQCLEQCYERSAVDERGAGASVRAPLYVPAEAPAPALPAGFYLARVGGGGGVRIDLARVCATLGISAERCQPR